MKKDIKNLSTIAIFSAIIIVLQLVATFINFGGFPITLTLIPIIIAAAVYGEKMGFLMGSVFGVVVIIMVITGADPSGSVMFAARPIITTLTCILKGALAGYFSGLAYKSIKNKKVAIVAAAFIAPITNTSLFYLALILFFESSFTILVTGLMSINFIIELLINVLIAPGLTVLIERQLKRQ